MRISKKSFNARLAFVVSPSCITPKKYVRPLFRTARKRHVLKTGSVCGRACGLPEVVSRPLESRLWPACSPRSRLVRPSKTEMSQ